MSAALVPMFQSAAQILRFPKRGRPAAQWCSTPGCFNLPRRFFASQRPFPPRARLPRIVCFNLPRRFFASQSWPRLVLNPASLTVSICRADSSLPKASMPAAIRTSVCWFQSAAQILRFPKLGDPGAGVAIVQGVSICRADSSLPKDEYTLAVVVVGLFQSAAQILRFPKVGLHHVAEADPIGFNLPRRFFASQRAGGLRGKPDHGLVSICRADSSLPKVAAASRHVSAATSEFQSAAQILRFPKQSCSRAVMSRPARFNLPRRFFASQSDRATFGGSMATSFNLPRRFFASQSARQLKHVRGLQEQVSICRADSSLPKVVAATRKPTLQLVSICRADSSLPKARSRLRTCGARCSGFNLPRRFFASQSPTRISASH